MKPCVGDRSAASGMRGGSRGPGRRAFALLEIMVIIAALNVFFAITVGLLWAAIRIERSAAADFERTLVQGALADQFRADVAGSTAAEIAGAPRRLILRQADAKAITYRWDGATLERSAGQAKQTLPLGVEKAGVEFIRSTDGRMIVLRVIETRGHGSTQRTERVEITAALGGDLR